MGGGAVGRTFHMFWGTGAFEGVGGVFASPPMEHSGSSALNRLKRTALTTRP